MSESATADAAATTDWRTYDGPVPQKFLFHVIFLPLLLAVCIMLPTALCYFCLCRSRPVPYSTSMMPNAPGLGTTSFPRISGVPCSSPTLWSAVSFSLPPPKAVQNPPSVGVARGTAAAASKSTLVEEESCSPPNDENDHDDLDKPSRISQ